MYVVGIILGRMNRRFIGRRTVANFFLFVFIGSVLAAAIIGDLFYEILGMAIAIIIFNWLVVIASYYISVFKVIIEGRRFELIVNSKIQERALSKCFIRKEELFEELRLQTQTSDISKV